MMTLFTSQYTDTTIPSVATYTTSWYKKENIKNKNKFHDALTNNNIIGFVVVDIMLPSPTLIL